VRDADGDVAELVVDVAARGEEARIGEDLLGTPGSKRRGIMLKYTL